MFDDFFIRALLAGTGVALVAGPLGCFVLWRRMAYFGDALAHSSLLGIALALVFQINITLSVMLVTLTLAGLLLALQRQRQFHNDALLGLFAHSSLALGLVILSFAPTGNLYGFLFGDLLAVTQQDLWVIYAGGALILLCLVWIWRALFATSLNYELAHAEGLNPRLVNALFLLLVALVVAIAIKIVGVLLITSLLLIPGATARRLTSSPEAMACMAALCGVLAVIGGLYFSLGMDTPSGPSIVLAAICLFVLSLWKQKHPG